MQNEIETAVTATLVPDAQRMGFLPRVFRASFLTSEGLVYNWMRGLAPEDYAKGNGYWHFYDLSNGGFFMAPQSPESLTLFVDGNGFEGSMSAQAAGIVACLFALCQLANTDGRDQDHFIDQYHNLRAYAADHAEAALIYRAID